MTPKVNVIRQADDQVLIETIKGTIILDAADGHLAETYSLSLARTKTTAFVVAVDNRNRKVVRLAKLIMQPAKGLVVDHINGDPLDNRRANLRCITASGNAQNRAKRIAGTTSRYKGVSRRGGRWFACLYENYRQIGLGFHETEVAAAHAYDSEARRRFGQCAALNFPKAGEQSAHRPRTITFHPTPNTPERNRNHG